MSRRRKGKDVHGVILLDKPAGRSSSQATQSVRRLLQARKAGHTGSLDPFATGMLPVCLGEASKTAGFMLDASKTYEAEALLGAATTTGDTEGDVCGYEAVPPLERDFIERALERFRGTIEQLPPMYSALKYKGRRLYDLAREGKEVERQPRQVTIHSLELLDWEDPVLRFRVHCSKGTYVRTLAEDIAREMGTCAHLQSLRRLSVEPFLEQAMVPLKALESAAEAGSAEDFLLPVDAGLAAWPVAVVDGRSAERFSHGNPVDCGTQEPGLVRVRGPQGKLLGIGEITSDKLLKPKRIMLL